MTKKEFLNELKTFLASKDALWFYQNNKKLFEFFTDAEIITIEDEEWIDANGVTDLIDNLMSKGDSANLQEIFATDREYFSNKINFELTAPEQRAFKTSHLKQTNWFYFYVPYNVLLSMIYVEDFEFVKQSMIETINESSSDDKKVSENIIKEFNSIKNL